MASRPVPQKRPSGLVVVLAFGVAITLTVALVVVALVARGGSDSPDTPAAPAVSLAGIPQSGAFLGSPAAKVTLIEYADLQCPACREYSETIFPIVVREYVRTGKVRLEFRGFPFIGDDSMKAQRFVLAAAEQNRLWNLVDALYRNQGGENAGWLTDDLLRTLAAEIPGLDADKLFADAESAATAQRAEQSYADAQAAGVPGTPTLFVKIGDEKPYFIQNGDADHFRAALDDALSG
jgi:protein-disulfide isomerase